jgi:PelA/Pel-15E family pectate lyase
VLGWILLAASLAFANADDPYLDGFRDSISHWQKKRNLFDYPKHDPADVKSIAENVLLLQRQNGGWPPNEEVQRILTDAERAQWQNDRVKLDTSFDNRTSYTHLRYLAHAFQVTGDQRFGDGAIRGLEFVLSAESPSGGWPHSFPRTGAYYRHITFMDDVTIGVLSVLREAAQGTEPFAFLSPSLRDRCSQAVARGTSLLLQLQVDIDGRRTIWAGQYDEKTLAPCAARTFEPPALAGAESVTVIQYLMEIPSPTPQVIAAVESAVAWYKEHPVRGVRIEKINAPAERFTEHTSQFDLIQVDDPNAPLLWARFYDLKTEKPLLCDRDGRIVDRLEKLSRERRTGYRWFGDFAQNLLDRDYQTWKSGVAR